MWMIRTALAFRCQYSAAASTHTRWDRAVNRDRVVNISPGTRSSLELPMYCLLLRPQLRQDGIER